MNDNTQSDTLVEKEASKESKCSTRCGGGCCACSWFTLIILPLALFYGGLWWSFSNCSADWKSAAPSPIPRFEGPSAVVGEKLYTFFGYSSYTADDHTLHATDKVYSYEPAADKWASLSDSPFAGTHLNPAVDGTDVWFAGGFKGDHPGEPLKEVWKYDTVADSWSPGVELPEARGGGALVRLGRNLHYIGGYYFAEQEPSANDHWAISLDGGTAWERRARLPMARGHMGIAALGGKIYAMGGSLTHHPNYIDTDLAHAYDPKKDEWKQIASLPSPRSHYEPGTFTFGGRIYLFGGRDNMSGKLSQMEMPDALVYDPVSNEWSELNGLPYPLRAPVAQLVGNTLVLTNGSTYYAEKPQTVTFTISCTSDPGSYCSPSGFTASYLGAKAKLRKFYKGVGRVLPLRVQRWMGFSWFSGD